jgi:hypothetical protein
MRPDKADEPDLVKTGHGQFVEVGLAAFAIAFTRTAGDAAAIRA